MSSVETLTLTDAESVADLRTFLTRARSVIDGEVALVSRGAALAVYVPVLVPEALGDGAPTVLGMRAFRCAAPSVQRAHEISQVFPIGAITDRLARMNPLDVELSLPPAEVAAAWAGVLPPVQGWKEVGAYDVEDLLMLAEEGMRAVADALPPNAGKPVLATVRSRIWASTFGRGSVPELPRGAAFAAQTLGFLPSEGSLRVLSNGPWHRLASSAGHVLVRRGTRLI